MMQTSKEGGLFTARREALVLVGYPDGDYPSAGFGHNSVTNKIGQHIDPELKRMDVAVRQAFKWLRQDLAKWERVVNAEIKVPLKQHQFDALVDLAYNTGNRYVHTIIKAINEGMPPEELKELWLSCNRNKAGKVLKGLTYRRELEYNLYETGDYGPQTLIPFWTSDPHTTKPQPGGYTPQEGDLDWS